MEEILSQSPKPFGTDLDLQQGAPIEDGAELYRPLRRRSTSASVRASLSDGLQGPGANSEEDYHDIALGIGRKNRTSQGAQQQMSRSIAPFAGPETELPGPAVEVGAAREEDSALPAPPQQDSSLLAPPPLLETQQGWASPSVRRRVLSASRQREDAFPRLEADVHTVHSARGSLDTQRAAQPRSARSSPRPARASLGRRAPEIAPPSASARPRSPAKLAAERSAVERSRLSTSPRGGSAVAAAAAEPQVLTLGGDSSAGGRSPSVLRHTSPLVVRQQSAPTYQASSLVVRMQTAPTPQSQPLHGAVGGADSGAGGDAGRREASCEKQRDMKKSPASARSVGLRQQQQCSERISALRTELDWLRTQHSAFRQKIKDYKGSPLCLTNT